MRTSVQRRDVSRAVLSRSSMVEPDYVDFFTATTALATSHSPEYWARAVVARAAGLGGQFIWRVVLGLHLESTPTTERVGGWKIAECHERWIRLEAASRSLTAHIVIHVDAGEMSMATFLRYDRPFGAALWRTLSAVHRGLMPGLLRNAVRLVDADGESTHGAVSDAHQS